MATTTIVQVTINDTVTKTRHMGITQRIKGLTLVEKEERVCTKCVMDTTDPEISFDESGVCNHCQTYEARKKAFLVPDDSKKERLDSIISYCKKKGREKPYDCVIGVSGGVDSTYVAWLVKSLGLRPLAVHLDNGWDSELAVSNIRNVLARLGIDLHTHVLDWEEFKSLQLAFLRASTPDSEIPSDHAIVALMRQIAAGYNIPVIWGVNFSSESILPRAWSQGHMDWNYIRRVNRLYGTKRLHNYPHYSIWKLIYYQRIKLQLTFDILNYVDYDKEAAKSFLINDLGWRDYGGKHHESIYTRIFQSYILPEKFGYDKRRAHLSSLILAGQCTREIALKQLEVPPFDSESIEEDIEYLVKKLGITRGDFDLIMNSEVKRYEDYKSELVFRIRKAEYQFFESLFRLRRNIIKSIRS
jgi:N-acetyl sugar amidotransferase